MWFHRSRYAAVAALAVAVACSKQDKSAAAGSASATAIDTVLVTARDFAFEAPSQIPAGVTTFRLVNQGKQLHHVQVLKFEQGKTLDDFMTAMKGGGPIPAWVVEMGGPNAPVPGGTFSATLSLDPGNYALVCFVDTPDHVPHVMKGMSHPFVVTPRPGVPLAAEPTADITLTLKDYGFTFSKPLTAGTHTIRVENAGPQAHEVEIVRLDSGKTVDDVLKWAEHYQGPPPATPIGGMTGISPGQHGFFTVDLTKGEYGLICFYPDKTDGKPHFMHGMKQQLTIE